ncbi:MAG: ASKHA domain-containing protein [Anaerolineales bacterium]|nr:ASKHA domain-containing protein [Anaerolineales bacterium]
MTDHLVVFQGNHDPVRVATGTLITEAARRADVVINQPCGGQGRCGRCAVAVNGQGVRRRSTLRLSPADIEEGYALACQAVIEGDLRIRLLPQESIERRLTTDRTVAKISVPEGYAVENQSIRRLTLNLPAPTVDDQTDDWSRLQKALHQAGYHRVELSLPLLRRLGPALREGSWTVTVVIDSPWGGTTRLIDILPGEIPAAEPLWSAAVDVGTTTITVWLVDLMTGEVRAQSAEYNGQIARGEDVISRIIFASKNSGAEDLRKLALDTINSLVKITCGRVLADPRKVVKAAISGNSTMLHLLLGVPAESIRLAPFITAVNQPPPLTAADLELDIHPEASVDCLPGVASYVGADITAGVLASGVDDSEEVSLFIDVGTNGEIVLGSRDWLVTCACSAGPAFEGAGVMDGVRAAKGAIEEVWINAETFEPTFRVIGGGKPRGICGSGLISLLAELFLTGVLDKAGNINSRLSTARIRTGPHGLEYVIAWRHETSHERDITLKRPDIDNLLRAKAAIYAGFTVLAEAVGYPLEAASRVLIGGAFGKYINIEKAVEIGLLPDLPWEQFHFLGNTSVKGAYLSLLDQEARSRINDIAGRMTYVELSADNSFYEAFTSALFLPHTDVSLFPSVARELALTAGEEMME